MKYLIRYGLMGHIGQFRASDDPGSIFHRGQVVVIRSNRGVEMGEVLTDCGDPGLSDPAGGVSFPQEAISSRTAAAGRPNLYRAAGSEDFLRALQVDELQPDRFSMCKRILDEDGWPWELLDVEPLLDGETIVLHYLGPHDVDVADLRVRFRMLADIDIVLEPVGIDIAIDHPAASDGQRQCDSGCGSSGCGSGGYDGGGCQSSASTSGCGQVLAVSAAGLPSGGGENRDSRQRRS